MNAHSFPQVQRGFTLIEVVVAFAVFALCIGALYESFASSSRLSSHTRKSELAWLAAQSLLSAQRTERAPWPPSRSGKTPEGLLWRIDATPYAATASDATPWTAYQVSVRVAASDSTGRWVVLESIELARREPL